MLYQQGTQRIEVIVKKESGAGTAGAKETDPDKTSADGGEELQQTEQTGGMSAKTKRMIKVNATHALAVTKQVVDLAIEYNISGIGMKNGDQALQDVVGRKMEIFKDTTNVATSIGIGLTYGSAGGPIGMVLGAALGALSSTASVTTKYMGRTREYNFKMFKEENAIEYKRARANINLTTGRLR